MFPFSRNAGENKNSDSTRPNLSAPILVAGSRVPFFKEIFTGRKEEMEALITPLTSSEQPGQRVIIFGKPGSGKTQLAAAFCAQYEKRFQGIHWIEGSLPCDVALQIAEIGQTMQITPWPEKLPDQVEATLSAWKQTPNQLVILSHWNDPANVETWLKKFGQVAVLITTSNIDWPGNYLIRPLSHLKREDSLAILRKLSPRLAKSSDEALAPLFQGLGGLPLALNLAARYLNEQVKFKINDYLVEIKKAADIAKNNSGENPNALPRELAAVISLSTRLLQGKNERERVAQRIFEAASYCFANIPIPLDLLRQTVETSGEKSSFFERSLRWLYDLGLLQQTSNGPMIHPSVSEFSLQSRANSTEVLTPLAISVLNVTSEITDSGAPQRKNLPHLHSVAIKAEEARVIQASGLWNILGTHLHNAGELASAKECFDRSLAIDLRQYGSETTQVAQTNLKLGRVLVEQGNHHDAQKCFEKALAITEKVYSPVYPEVATILNELGMVYYDLDDLPSAKDCYERAISIHENAFGYGPKHPAIATEAVNLGRVLRDMNDLQGAKKYFQRALVVHEWVYGPKHSAIVTYANYLGRVLYTMGELAEARDCFDRVSALLEETHGPEFPGLAVALNNLGLVLQDLGNLNRASECFSQALKIDEKVFGLEHPNIARDANNLGGVYSALGNYPAARDCFSRALAIDSKIFGESHPNNATNANNLARVLYNMGDLIGAKTAFEQTLAIDEKVYGPKHSRVGTDANNLATVLFDMGDLGAAKTYFQRALEIFQKELPQDHPKTQRARNYLENIAQKQMD